MPTASLARNIRHGLVVAGLVVLTALPACAYIGPGAGFVLVSSFMVFLVAFVLAGSPDAAGLPERPGGS